MVKNEQLYYIRRYFNGGRPVEELYGDGMEFIGYLYDENGETIGIKAKYDSGSGYGFDYGRHEVDIMLYEEFTFNHRYTDTSDGTWNKDDVDVTIILIKEEDAPLVNWIGKQYRPISWKNIVDAIKNKLPYDEVKFDR